MRFISHLVLSLCALMVAASIDAVPDPPAVTQHQVKEKTSCLREIAGAFHQQPASWDSACLAANAPTPTINRIGATKPKRSSDWITLTVYASDPSPPVL